MGVSYEIRLYARDRMVGEKNVVESKYITGGHFGEKKIEYIKLFSCVD